jgi:hypothetical protein
MVIVSAEYENDTARRRNPIAKGVTKLPHRFIVCSVSYV